METPEQSAMTPGAAADRLQPGVEPGDATAAGTARRRPRGEGSAQTVVFRNPPPLDAEAHALRLAIAASLVRAPSLPVPLPMFRLALLDVRADRRGIDLLIGPTNPVAALRFEPRKGAELQPLGGARPGPATVRVVDLHAAAAQFRRELSQMAERVAAALTDEKWDAAWAQAKQLQRLPVDVPLGFFRQMVAGIDFRQGLVRTGFLCNQDCGICWQGRDWGRFGANQVVAWIEDLRAAGAESLIISGGEPTLDPELPRYVARARELGYRSITLETNAIQFAKAGAVEKLRDAGMTECFVSLHSGDAAVSDAIARAPGTFARTVKGIHALLAAGIPVGLNCVLTNEGLEHVEGLPDFIHDTFGLSPQLSSLMLSLPTDSFDPSLNRSIIPEPVRLRQVLRRTLDRAFAVGLQIRGLDGPCGPPLCAFGADPRIASLRAVPEPLDFRRHLPACDGCAVKHACFGVRTAQFELYGDACAAPIAIAPVAGAL